MDGVIIQARTGSTRLPGKILLPFYGEKRIIDIQIEAIRAACPGMRIVLATTTRRQDNVLADVAPSILHILGMPQPADMTGKDLIS